MPKEQLREIVAEVTKAIPEEDRVIALDTVLSFIDKSTIVARDVPGIKADPPAIFFSTTPAVVVNFDGDPIWSPIAKNDLKFAVNTNWDVFQHEPTRTFYLRYNTSWLTAPAATGPWALPAAAAGFSLPRRKLAEVKKAVPGSRCPPTSGPRQRDHVPRRAHSAARSAGLSAGDGDDGSCGCPTPRATSSAWARPDRCITSWPADGSRRRL